MTLISDLYKLHSNVINMTGGPTNFLAYLLSQPDYYNQYVLPLANCNSQLAIISPWNRTLNLNTEDSSTLKQILVTEPYRVYTINGELLYSVANHNGYFGSSVLDQALIYQSKVLEFYYLQYETYLTPTNVLLIVNKFLPLSNQQETNKQEQIVQSEEANQLTLSLSTSYPNAPISIYVLEALPYKIPSPFEVLNNPLSNNITLDNDGVSTIIPEASCWIVVHQNINSIDYFLNLIPGGQGLERLLNPSPGLYYLALPKDIDYGQLQQIFNFHDPIPNTLSSVNITASISI